MHGLDDPLFNVIFSYTRKKAIEDGNLIEVTEQAKQAGFKVPVAISLNLYRTTDNTKEQIIRAKNIINVQSATNKSKFESPVLIKSAKEF